MSTPELDKWKVETELGRRVYSNWSHLGFARRSPRGLLSWPVARWADDIRASDKQQHRALWHYIQLALQARWTTIKRTNQRTRAGEHPDRDG
jgi:hypothetical protein